MKENLSPKEIKYIKRRLARNIRRAIEGVFSVAVISGARQVGKSTMIQNEFQDFAYYTLDDYETVDLLRTDPEFIFKKSDRIVIDEVQKYPDILNTVKLAVDRDKNKKVILSGSSNILLMKNVSETLAGRAAYFELLPMTYGEYKGIETPNNFLNLWKGEKANIEENAQCSDSTNGNKNNTNTNTNTNYNGDGNCIVDTEGLMLKGFMPANITRKSNEDVLMWMDAYIKTYLERDLRQLSQIESLIDFRKLMQVLALRTANILKQSEVAKDSGLSPATTYRYIKLLEVSNIIERVPSFFTNRVKRVIKSPKIFFIDVGLAVFLSGYYDKESLLKAREYGSFFETMVFLHLKSLCNTLTPQAKLYYFRTTSQKEVDFIIEHGNKILAIEVKAKESPKLRDVKNLVYFMDNHPETVLGLVLHKGNEIKWLTSKILSVPWWWLEG